MMWSSAVALQPPPASLVDVIFDKHLPACRRRYQVRCQASQPLAAGICCSSRWAAVSL